MDIRKYFLIIAVTVSSFLFCVGIVVLWSINSVNTRSNSTSSALNEFIEPFEADSEPFNTLFMVKDSDSDNTDTMLLLNFDPSGTKVNVMSIPRDTYYKVKGSTIPKINSAYPYGGPEYAAGAASNLLCVNIKYYIHIDISTFRQIVDLLDGVEFYVPVDLDYDDEVQDLHIHLKKGMQKLDGDKAEQLLRFRKTQDKKYKGEISKYYDGSDLKREEMQKEFIRALIDQKMSIKYLPKINEVIEIVFDNIATNITLSDALQYSEAIVKIKSYDINWHQLPGTPEEKQYSFFVADRDEAVKITSEYFVGEDSFVNMDEYAESIGSPDKDPDLFPDLKDMTRNNPSNNETNIKPESSDPV